MKAHIEWRRLALTFAIVSSAAFTALTGKASGGEIKDFKFPVPTFDQDGNEADYVIQAGEAPPPGDVTVYGWWPDMKMLLIQLRPDDPRTAVYVSYYAVVMSNPAAWDQRMRASGMLVCAHVVAPPPVQATNPATIVTASKGFKNPC